MICAGIDYSMTSPAVCVSSKPGHFKVHYLCKQKKLHGTFTLAGPETTLILIGSPSFTDESDMGRYNRIGEWAISGLVSDGIPNQIALEDYAYAAKGRVFHIGENTGILKHKMWKSGLNWNPCEPTRLKAFADASKRKDHDSKDLMESRFIEETSIDIRTYFELGDKVRNPVSDIIDAYWLCQWSRANA